MLILFLSTSLLLTVLMLIIAFGNIGAQCTYLVVLFSQIDTSTSVTFLIFALSFLGILTGLSYAGLIWAVMKSKGEESEEEE